MDDKEVKHIFIDANVYLDLYRFGKEDLEELNKLHDFIKNGDVKLYLTKQAKEEFYRNREEEFRKTFSQFETSNVSIKMSSLFKTYSDYNIISKLQDALRKAQADLKDKVLVDVREKTLKADGVVEKLFEVAEFIDTDIYLPQAIKRFHLGNPPGKKSSGCGDEINWEAFLERIPDNTKFVIISGDKDYKSSLFPDKINDFLYSEWKNKKKSDIYTYNTLVGFFNEHDLVIKLEVEEAKNHLVTELINSGNYMRTHELVRRLTFYSSFTNEQIKGLVTALLGNSQVRWIADDADVKSFYKEVVIPRVDILDEDINNEVLSIILDDGTSSTEVVDKIINFASETSADEIPF